MKRLRQKPQRDPVISLINIVFLILIFFMVAGSLSSPPDPSIKFVQTQNLECCVPPNAISVDEFGHFTQSGGVITIDKLVAEHRDQSSPRVLSPLVRDYIALRLPILSPTQLEVSTTEKRNRI